MAMKIGIPKETVEGELRVAATPDTAKKLLNLGFQVAIETQAGAGAHFIDDAYSQIGVEVVDDAKSLWSQSDIILKVRAPQIGDADCADETALMPDGGCLISFIWPAQNPQLMDQLKMRHATVIAMDAVPRISRAQKLDALSSMANIAGYRAVVEAANRFGRFFTGQITAAGKVPPAKVLVIGAGVAGLAAIGAANAMGAVVRAFDTRPEVKDQVESLGAQFLMLDFEESDSDSGPVNGYAKTMSEAFIEAEMKLFAEQAREVDIIITTALIPGRPAPKLISAAMVESMRDGSVIIDLAAEQGGNCALTEPGKAVIKHGVSIVGFTDLPSRMAAQSSQLYGTNLVHLLNDLTPEKNGEIHVDMSDDVIRGATVIKQGEITWPPPPISVSATPGAKAAVTTQPPPQHGDTRRKGHGGIFAMVAGGLLLATIGYLTPPDFLAHFTVFLLACFVGYMVIWKVTPALHTPLMSVTNAISGIIVIGALLQISSTDTRVGLMAAFAILIATINIAGGFLVTQRMLKMFQK